MNVVLWVVQALLALLFAMSGVVKLVEPMEKLAGRYPWVHDFSARTVRLIGVLEVLGAVGVLVPVLAPLAATGLAVLMALAAGVHVRRRERSAVPITAALLALSAFVAWGRFGPYGW